MVWLVLILAAFVYLLPIYVMIVNGLKESANVSLSTMWVPLTTFTKIMLPLSIPAFVVVCIFQFTNIWNDFLFGITVVPNPKAQPVTVALNNLSGSFSLEWNVVMAGAAIAALPTALIFIFLGRYFVQGILAGSVKR